MERRVGPKDYFSIWFRKGLGLLGGAIVLVGCLNNPGVDPPVGELNFPIAIAMSPPGAEGESEFLFVANSNFDIRYNNGTIQAYSLDRLNACVGTVDDPNRCFIEDNCVVVDPARARANPAPLEERRCEGIRAGEVRTDSYSTGLALSADGRRLFSPMRSTSSLTVVDVDPASGALACGGNPAQRHICTEAYARGVRQVDNARDVQFPGDPVGIHVGPIAEIPGAPVGATGEYFLVPHRGGAVSLLLDGVQGEQRFPTLVDVVANLQPDLIGIQFDVDAQLAWMTSASQPVVARVGIEYDAERSILYDAGSLAVRGIDTAGRPDLRDIAFDPRPGIPFGYVLSRSPQAVITVDLARSTAGLLEPIDVLDVCQGPSKLRVELFPDANVLLGFVTCFDSRELYVLDLDQRQLVGIVRGLSGPFEIAVDPPRGRVYVADFRASTVQVINLEPLFDCIAMGAPMDGNAGCSPRVIGVLGRPRPVRELR